MSFVSDRRNFVDGVVAFALPLTSGDDVVHISKNPLTNLYKVDVNGQVYFMTKKELEATDFELGAGDGKFIAGSGNDTLIGGTGHDQLNGGSDNNTLVSDAAHWLLPPRVRVSELTWSVRPRPGGVRWL